MSCQREGGRGKGCFYSIELDLSLTFLFAPPPTSCTARDSLGCLVWWVETGSYSC